MAVYITYLKSQLTIEKIKQKFPGSVDFVSFYPALWHNETQYIIYWNTDAIYNLYNPRLLDYLKLKNLQIEEEK